MECLQDTHGHDFLGWRRWVGFSLGQWPFGHVIPLRRVAGCGVCSGKEGQGEKGKGGGRKSGNRAGRGGGS